MTLDNQTMGLIERALLKQIRRRIETQLPNHRLEVMPNEYRQSGEMLRVHLRAPAVCDLHESNGEWWMSLAEFVNARMPSIDRREHFNLELSDTSLVSTVANQFSKHVREVEQLAEQIARASIADETASDTAAGPVSIADSASIAAEEEAVRIHAVAPEREVSEALHLQATRAAKAERQAELAEEEWVKQTKRHNAAEETRAWAEIGAALDAREIGIDLSTWHENIPGSNTAASTPGWDTEKQFYEVFRWQEATELPWRGYIDPQFHFEFEFGAGLEDKVGWPAGIVYGLSGMMIVMLAGPSEWELTFRLDGELVDRFGFSYDTKPPQLLTDVYSCLLEVADKLRLQESYAIPMFCYLVQGWAAELGEVPPAWIDTQVERLRFRYNNPDYEDLLE